MTRQSYLRHCCEWFRAAWKSWLRSDRDSATRDGGAAAADFCHSRIGPRNLVKHLLLLLTVLTFSSSIALVAAASSSASRPISASLELNSNLSSRAYGRLFQSPNWRGSRLLKQEDRKPANARRLSGQYLCRWKKEICELEPINFLLGPDCCNSVCINMKTDVFNCGTCGHICFYGSVCCNGDCIEIFSDYKNCGACNNICPRGEMCQYGLCGYSL